MTPPPLGGLALLRGIGARRSKSAELLLVSWSPPPLRMAAVVLLNLEVAVPSAQFALPKPTRSITPVVGQAPDNAVAELARATLPSVPDIAVPPSASGFGNG